MIHNNFRRIALAQGLLQAHPCLSDRPDSFAPAANEPRGPNQPAYADGASFGGTDEPAREPPRQV